MIGVWRGLETKKAHLSVSLLSTAYGAAPRVENIYNYQIYNNFICRDKVFYLLKYPLALDSHFIVNKNYRALYYDWFV